MERDINVYVYDIMDRGYCSTGQVGLAVFTPEVTEQRAVFKGEGSNVEKRQGEFCIEQ